MEPASGAPRACDPSSCRWADGGGQLSTALRTRRLHLLWSVERVPCLTLTPSAPTTPLAGFLLLALVAAAAYSSGRHSGRLEVSGCAGLSPPADGDTVAPEGSISASFAYTHDYAGRPRSVRSAGGVVAADHGRCSEIGEGAGGRSMFMCDCRCSPACLASAAQQQHLCHTLPRALQARRCCARVALRLTPPLLQRCARACTTPVPAAWVAATSCSFGEARCVGAQSCGWTDAVRQLIDTPTRLASLRQAAQRHCGGH